MTEIIGIDFSILKKKKIKIQTTVHMNMTFWKFQSNLFFFFKIFLLIPSLNNNGKWNWKFSRVIRMPIRRLIPQNIDFS